MAIVNSSELFHASLEKVLIHTHIYIVRRKARHNALKGHSVMETYVEDPVGIA